MSKQKEAKTGKIKNLMELSLKFDTEQACRDYLAALRWPKVRTCPHCGHDKTYEFKSGKLYKCAKCRKQFTVTKGTIFEASHVPLRKWFFAIYLMTSHKKGISSCQLARDIGVTQKTAWFICHRIRKAIKTKAFRKAFTGTVEADETYVGGKSANHRGRGTTDKAAVFGMVERESGEVLTKHVKHVDKKTLQGMLRRYVKNDSRIITDDFKSYTTLREDYIHDIIRHSYKKYVRGDIHTNTIEGFWSLLKRGILGIYHQVSPKHLARYLDEFSYRYNTRKTEDAPRFESALKNCEGRLTYAALIR